FPTRQWLMLCFRDDPPPSVLRHIHRPPIALARRFEETVDVPIIEPFVKFLPDPPRRIGILHGEGRGGGVDRPYIHLDGEVQETVQEHVMPSLETRFDPGFVLPPP